MTACFFLSECERRGTYDGHPAAVQLAHLGFIIARTACWELALVAPTSTSLYHDPHDPLQKGIIFQSYICILDSEQSGNGPKVELRHLSDKV
jgi:hypothetical protein